MIAIQKARDLSWLSQASYLGFDGIAAGTSGAALSTRVQTSAEGPGNVFAEGQADTFANSSTGFRFVSQLPNTPNGTSVAVFGSNDSNDGAYTISVRGTEPFGQLVPTDLLQDLFGVVLAGKAKVQLIEAFRYYKQVTTPGGQAVVYSNQEVNAISSVLLSGTILTGQLENLAAAIVAFQALSANDKRLGASGQTLVPNGSKVNFTGHSLGGHVAYLLAQLVESTRSDSRSLGDVVTYNAPGENALIFEIQNWMGIDTSSQAGTIGSKHLALYGLGGLNVTAGLGQVIGTRKPIFIETDGPILGGLSIGNHS